MSATQITARILLFEPSGAGFTAVDGETNLSVSGLLVSKVVMVTSGEQTDGTR